MSQIAYDPVKDKFARIIRNSRFLRTLFYFMLDMLFLRSWHVKRTLKKLKQGRLKGQKSWKILDAGCGFGQYDRFLLKLLPEAVIDAVDVKEEYLEDCKLYYKEELNKGRIVFRKADLLTFDEKSKYDFILCVDVLEHIKDDLEVMHRLNQALKPDGYLLMHSPSHLAKHDAGDDEFFVDEHARVGYSREELADRFHDTGYDPVKIQYTYGKWGHAAWVMLIKWPMLALIKIGFLSLIVLPFWYALVLLPSLLFMRLDLHSGNPDGTGILGLAQKSRKIESTLTLK